MTDKDTTTGKEVDYVNNPPHYHTGQIECIEAMSLKKEWEDCDCKECNDDCCEHLEKEHLAELIHTLVERENK